MTEKNILGGVMVAQEQGENLLTASQVEVGQQVAVLLQHQREGGWQTLGEAFKGQIAPLPESSRSYGDTVPPNAINVMPEDGDPMPARHEFANGHPRLITQEAFMAVINEQGQHGVFRHVVMDIAPSEEFDGPAQTVSADMEFAALSEELAAYGEPLPEEVAA